MKFILYNFIFYIIYTIVEKTFSFFGFASQNIFDVKNIKTIAIVFAISWIASSFVYKKIIKQLL